jgi:hypothetical protein
MTFFDKHSLLNYFRMETKFLIGRHLSDVKAGVQRPDTARREPIVNRVASRRRRVAGQYQMVSWSVDVQTGADSVGAGRIAS